MKTLFVAGAITALAFGFAIPAQAQTANVHLTFDADGTFSDVNADLTVQSGLNAFGTHDVTGISGTIGSDVISGLVPNNGFSLVMTSTDGLFLYDNRFNNLQPALSNAGLLFTDNGGHEDNLWSVDATTFNLIRSPGNYPNGVNGSFKAQLTAGVLAVPEPATWALMIIGFGGMGATLRSKRRKAAIALT